LESKDYEFTLVVHEIKKWSCLDGLELKNGVTLVVNEIEKWSWFDELELKNDEFTLVMNTVEKWNLFDELELIFFLKQLNLAVWSKNDIIIRS